MFMNRLSTALLLALASAAPAFAAASSDNVARATWDPKILAPTAQTVWQHGQVFTVTWDTSNPPASVTNPNGEITLSKSGQDSSVLASNFALKDGSVEVTVPSDAEPGSDYHITLFGDSGNVSEDFTIQ
ncbi:uncharacterized protein B0H18DRAFT_1113662 [Fomitopsis serialis]|uniref:uncharacterized protein n=1 Tax=Fomitopsis serialis TaxID=139415 RepID=UPI0020082896|nr:uncharacterized protein B0H18DRAFT_1113662 [Neoantrodia serialis]KAH9936239.1 hypothetical protein B0H18DRAFT_1113662 [Neoantrodia serialis]